MHCRIYAYTHIGINGATLYIETRHARRQMKWRKIEENEVKEAISDPVKLEDTVKGRKNAFKIGRAHV